MEASTPCVLRRGAAPSSACARKESAFRFAARLAGFTLIELMVVVALIGILAAVIGFSISGGGQAAALESAQRNLIAMFQSAKSNAILEGAPARLIIYADTNAVDPSAESSDTINPKCLRYYGVIYSQTAPDGTVTWTAANQGATLPSGIYFLPAASSQFATDLPTEIPATPQNALLNRLDTTSSTTYAYGTMKLPQFPSNQPQAEGDGDTYYYIQFTPDGIFRDQTYGTTANVILAAGDLTSPNTVDFHGQQTAANANTNQMLSGVQLRFLGMAPFGSALDITGGK
jgi:prepilin-type N-terminal cleavage/methylation domain-containing protein